MEEDPYSHLLPQTPRKEVIKMLFLPREEGQGLVEYALILVLIAIVVIAILLLLGPVVGNVFSTIVGAL
jgi:pilus assembly protein Flp/PilA